MTVYLDERDRPRIRKREAYHRQISTRGSSMIRARPALMETSSYPVMPITSKFDAVPAVVVASSIIFLKFFMLGLLLYSL